MSAKVIEQTKNSTFNQDSASLENNQTIKEPLINELPKPCGLELVPHIPAADQQQAATSSRTDSYKSRSMFAFLVAKL